MISLLSGVVMDRDSAEKLRYKNGLTAVVRDDKMAAVSLSVIPKAETLSVHTGNIVNWESLRRTINQSATEEVARPSARFPPYSAYFSIRDSDY